MAYKYTRRIGDFEIVMEVNTFEELVDLSERLATEVEEGEEADGDGWIEWSGGKCPVSPEVKTEVKFRSGRVRIRPAIEWCWSHASLRSDIIAYRVVKD